MDTTNWAANYIIKNRPQNIDRVQQRQRIGGMLKAYATWKRLRTKGDPAQAFARFGRWYEQHRSEF